MATKIPDVTADAGHMGRKIERIRLMRGMKQGALATALGVTQQAISNLEKSEKIDEEKLEKIADALNVTPDTIRNFDEDALVGHISNIYSNNTFQDSASADNYTGTVNHFNPVEHMAKLYDELLAIERNKVAQLEAQMQELKAQLSRK